MGGPLKKYTVITPQGVETVMKLNEADAKRLGVFQDEPAAAPAKARGARNKSRTAANKDAGGDG